jgi:Domain of unknown function (DUF4193)
MPDDDDEFDEDEPDIDDDEVDIDEDEDEVDIDLDGDVDVDVEEDVEVAEGEEPARTPNRRAKSGEEGGDDEDDDVVDLEEELHPDDVEEPLDVLLQERTKAERLDEDVTEVDDEELETDVPGEGTSRVRLRGDDEFLCRSCFLVKPLSQLAPGAKDLCRDCE